MLLEYEALAHDRPSRRGSEYTALPRERVAPGDTFADRGDAGRRLADLLDERDETADLVLTIPRGGLPVGEKVVDRLRAPLDVVVTSKVGTPDNPELVVGTIADNGNAWWNEDLLSYLDVGEGYLDRERECEAAATRDKMSLYRGGDPLPDVTEEHVVVVDNGVATGVTAQACLQWVIADDAGHAVLAVPVGPPGALSELEAECDTVIAVELPEAFGAVGVFYRDFTQVSDEETVAYLHDGVGEH